jgi:hypothetical protein
MQKNMKEKITVKVLIENDQLYTGDFVPSQKLHVIVHQASAQLKIQDEGRELKREDGTPLLDLQHTIVEAGIYEGETLRYFKKSPKPDRDKGFA